MNRHLVLALIVLTALATTALSQGVRVTIAEGTRIKTPDRDHVYLVDRGKLRYVNGEAHRKLWTGWDGVVTVAAIDGKTIGEPLGEGTRLVTGPNDTALWLLDNAKTRRRITSFEALRAFGFATALVERVPEPVLLAFPEGPAIGTVEKAPRPVAATYRGVAYDEWWKRLGTDNRAGWALAAFGPHHPGIAKRFAVEMKSEDRKRAATATTFAFAAGPAMVDPLVEAMVDPDQWIAASARSALGRIGKPAAPALRAALDDEKRRTAALFLLADIEPTTPGVIDGLVALLDSEEHDRMAERKLDAIENLPEEAAEALRRYKVEQEARFGDRAGHRNLKASGGSARLGRPGEGTLARAYFHRIREAATEGRLAPAWHAARADPDWKVRVAMMSAFSTVKPFPAAAEALVGAFSDSDRFVREEALKALVHMGPAAKPALARAAQSGDADLRWRAGRALAKIAEQN